MLSLLLAAHMSDEKKIGWSTIKCDLSLICSCFFFFDSYEKKRLCKVGKKGSKKRIELMVRLTQKTKD